MRSPAPSCAPSPRDNASQGRLALNMQAANIRLDGVGAAQTQGTPIKIPGIVELHKADIPLQVVIDTPAAFNLLATGYEEQFALQASQRVGRLVKGCRQTD